MATITIPEELLEQVERGNVLLFIGERLVRDADGGVALDRLAEQLAERSGLEEQHTYTFPEAAQAYEDEHGRNALVRFLREQLAALGDEPRPVHRLIASLTQCSVLVTTALNRRLERAFEEARRPLDVVVSNEDVPFEDESRSKLYKLRGSLDRVESLILTEDDHEDFFDSQASLSVVLQSYLARKTILFIGYDLDDPNFKRLFLKVTTQLDDYARRAYAFGESPPPKVSRWCARHGINVVVADTAAFLEVLVERLAARARPSIVTRPQPTAPDVPLPDRPYKQLDYYEAQDAAIFFGRQQEIQALSALIHAHRLTLIYGASGVGKTSLLLAGAAPRLEHADPPYTTIYGRALDDPAQAIRGAVLRRLPNADLPQNGELVRFLAATTRTLGHPLVIVLDQFEEFFIRLSPQFRAAFIAELGALYDAPDVPVKVVLSLREDWLASVNELEKRVPEIFRNRIRVLPLTRDQARESITAPVERLGVRYEPELVDRLLGDLAGSAGANVMPPQLQLVCSALYGGLKSGEQLITLAAYERIGGARGVLQQYLDGELARLPHDERQLARTALGDLVTSQGTKAVKTADEIALTLGEASSDLAPVLETLVRARLLRAIEREDGETAYELAHEYLIREIGLGAEAQTRKQAEELIRQEVDNWRRFNTLLAADKLALINDSRAVLRLGPDAQELLLRSALEVGDEIPYWLSRMADPEQRARVLADKARTRVASVRRRTAEVLGTQDVPASVEPLLELALRDADDAVRAAARASLAQLAGQRAVVVERLQAELTNGERVERRAARETLAGLPLRDLPRNVRPQIVATRTGLAFAGLAAQSTATPLRRAMLLTSGLMLAIVALAYLAAANSYYIDVAPSQIAGQPNQIVVRQGLPMLPLFAQPVVDTGVNVSRVPAHQWEAINGRQLWGVWQLRGKRDFHKWGKDLAVTLLLEDGVPMLWYLNRDEGLKALLEATESTDDGSRAWSADALGQLMAVYPETRDPGKLEILRALLKDAEAKVRVRAAAALCEVADAAVVQTEVVPVLLALLEEPDQEIHASAAAALGRAALNPQVDDTRIVPALLALLKLKESNDYLTRDATARALGRMAANSQPADAQIVPALFELLKDADPNVRNTASQALDWASADPQMANTQIVLALLARINDADTDVRSFAVRGLGQAAANPQVDDTRIVPALLTLLEAPDLSLRSIAIQALGQAASNLRLANDQVVPTLLALLKNSDSFSISSVVQALGQAASNPRLANAEIAPVLLALLDDRGSVYYARHYIALALGHLATNPRLANDQIVPALLALLTDDDYGVRDAAARALGQVATNPKLANDQVVPALLALLNQNNSEERNTAARALGLVAANPQVTNDQIVPALLPLLKETDIGVRYNAAQALGQAVTNPQLVNDEIAPALMALLKDANPAVRDSAADGLVQYYGQQSPHPESVAYLVRLSTEASKPLERPIAARALFLIALRDDDSGKRLRDWIDVMGFARSQEPIPRLWANKVLALMDIADLAHRAEQLRGTDREQLSERLVRYTSANFFGSDFTWAAQQALDGLNEQADLKLGATP